MKPLFIHMKNIGPFVDERLDFSSLDEIFLLCGDTGSGKTTIFDAMTYALYGEFLGARKNKAKDFRSQYAKDGEESFVEFEFSSGGERFRVRRTLPYTYTNRNGKKSVKDMEVSLEQWSPSDEKYEFINGGKTEIRAKLEEIVGLRAEEFAKIVVLPQGEFSEFLRANSNAKQEMLKKLFPVDFYQSIVEKIKEDNEELKSELKHVEDSIKELSKEIDFTNAENRIIDLTKEYEGKKAELDRLREEKENLTKAFTVLESDLKTSLELENAVSEKKKLEKKSLSIEKLEEKLALADEADSVVPFIEGVRTRCEEMDLAKKSAAECKTEVADAENALKLIKQSEKEIKKTESLAEKEKIQLKSLEDKLEVSEKYEKEAERQESVSGRVVELSEKFSDLEKKKEGYEDKLKNLAESVSVDERNKNPSEIYKLIMEKFSAACKNDQEVSVLNEKILERENLFKEISSNEKQLENLSEEKKKRVAQTDNAEKMLKEYRTQKERQMANDTACTLVSLLKKGCACPVCGSLEHPSPAKVSEEFLGLDEKILTAENSVKSEKELLSLCAEKTAAVSEVLKKLKKDFEKLSQECQNKTLEESEKDTAAAHEEMYRLQDASEKAETLLGQIGKTSEELSLLKEELSKAVAEKSSLEAVLKTLEEQMKKSGGDKTDSDEIQDEINSLSELLENHLKQVQSFNEELQVAEKKFDTSKVRLDASEASLESAVISYQTAKSVLESKLAASKFQSEKEAAAAYIKKEEKLEFKTEVKEFRREFESLETKISVLSKKVSQKPSQLQKKTELISAEMKEKEKLISEISDRVDELLSEKTGIEKDFNQYKKYSEKHRKLSEKGAPLSALCKDLTGNNPSKIQFETWFLGLYFDDVVNCANRHLLRISGERYEFKMDTESSGGNSYHGLDLVVHDYRTNRERDTATLSGGETFMASISLALGLTEVVQKSSRLDSLFIDEGFGSLDKESLEMAVGVLQDIGSSRMVGIISHVEEMLGAIPCHVEVKKTGRGSHIVGK